jgi:uncharacterized protein YjiS (DUF1127 family)
MLSQIGHRARRWRRYRRVLAELEFYSDRELADLGIARSDLRRIAKETAKQLG